MPRHLRFFAWTCLAASAVTAAVLVFGPQEGLESLGGGLLAVFTLFYHGLVGPLFIWHGFTARPLSATYLVFMLYMVTMWGIGITLYVVSNDLDDAAADYIEATTEPANFRIRELGNEFYRGRFRDMPMSADDRALWHQFGREATDVNRRDESRNPALWYAAAIGDVEMVRILLDKGALTDDDTLYYRSPLSIAVEKGHHEVVRQLVQAGADVNQGENRGRPSLAVATRNKDLEMLELLVASGADPNLGAPAPFSIALKEGEVETVSLLLDAGAEPVVYFHSEHPIEVALNNDDNEMVELLLAKTDGVNAISEHREPLLFVAFYECDLEAFQRYLELGADPDLPDRKGFTLLERMVYYRENPCVFEQARERFIGLMIETGVDLDRLHDRGESPAITALWHQQEALAEYLAANDATLDGLKANKDFLMLAAGAGNIALIDEALDRGMDINRRTEGMSGSIAIIEAARGGHTDAVRHLLSRGAELPARTSSLNMLFGLAGKHPAMVRLLLERYVELPADKRSDKHVRRGINGSRSQESRAMLKEFGIQ